jgi:murein DD-endopeptidase MepM/ murein hydrolase activator NlpD
MTVTSPDFRRSRGLRIAAMLPLAALLAACEGGLDADLRGTFGGFSTTQAAQTATADRPAADTRGLITYPSYQVAVASRGDKVADVAARVGLPAEEIARFNGVQTTDRLREGEVLVLPRRAPDSVASARSTPGSVDIEALAGSAIEASPATSPNPGSVTTTELQPSPNPQAIEPARVQDGPEPLRHKVKRGETAYTISRLYQVPVKSLADWNGLGSNFAIREGQYLLIPLKGAEKPASAAAVPAAEATAAAATSAPGEGSSTPVPPSAASPLPDQKVAAAAEAQSDLPTVDVPAPTRASTAAMSYPVKGKILRTYKKGKNEGIDIAAAAGAPVTAADGGTIAAITADANKVPIIVVRHDSKLLTVYANVDQIAVNKGDKVKRGQQIAQVRGGSSPYLHFEVRDGFDSVDPLPYLQ